MITLWSIVVKNSNLALSAIESYLIDKPSSKDSPSHQGQDGVPSSVFF
jgi:hypothetical protein